MDREHVDCEHRDEYERGALDYHAVYYRWLNKERAAGINPVYLDAMESVMRPFLEAYRKGEVRYISQAEADERFAKAAREFIECPECAAKPGTPTLCPTCLLARANAEQRFITPGEADAGFARAMGAPERGPTTEADETASERFWRELRVKTLTRAIDRRARAGGKLGPATLGKLREWMRELDNHLDWLASIREQHGGA